MLSYFVAAIWDIAFRKYLWMCSVHLVNAYVCCTPMANKWNISWVSVLVDEVQGTASMTSGDFVLISWIILRQKHHCFKRFMRMVIKICSLKLARVAMSSLCWIILEVTKIIIVNLHLMKLSNQQNAKSLMRNRVSTCRWYLKL